MSPNSSRRFWLLLLGVAIVHALLLVSWRTSLRVEAAEWAEERTLTFVISPRTARPLWAEEFMPERFMAEEPPPPETPIETELPDDEPLDPVEPLESAIAAEPLELELTGAKIDIRPMRHPPERRYESAAPSRPRAARQSAGSVVTYRARIRDRIERAKSYPYLARSGGRKTEGQVTVRFIIRRDGSLEAIGKRRGAWRYVEILAGSGSSMLDAAAARNVMRAQRGFPPFPKTLNQDRLMMTYNFNFSLSSGKR